MSISPLEPCEAFLQTKFVIYENDYIYTAGVIYIYIDCLRWICKMGWDGFSGVDQGSRAEIEDVIKPFGTFLFGDSPQRKSEQRCHFEF